MSHKTFANPFFVGIFCIWGKHVSISLFHTLAVPLAETMLVGDFCPVFLHVVFCGETFCSR